MRPMAMVLLLMSVAVMGREQTCAQETRDDTQVVRSVAERILAHGELAFRDTVTGKVYRSTAEAPQNAHLVLANHFGEWHYTNGVLNMAFVDLTAATGEKKYAAWAAAHCAFGMDNYRWFEKRYTPEDGPYNTVPFGQLWMMRELDDCGAMAASMIGVLPSVQRDDFREYIARTARHITEKQTRLADGTLARPYPPGVSIWGDDLYMSVPFLARMGTYSGDRRYWDDAVRQVQAFTQYLWDPKKELYFHCYYAGLQRNGVAHWGRCNGWVMMAKVHLLNALPADHPGRAAVIHDLEQQILGIAQYQNADGLWHQLLDKNDSYVETSSSAMFTYCIARAVNQGWIDARYGSIARAGWEGLKKHKIHADGQVDDICIGTGIEDNLVFYYTRPARGNEKHGLGAVIEAGIEVMRLKR
jgi:unsaturated rhamnogalacturonyl hydrolase